MSKTTSARIRMTVAGAAIAVLIAGGALGAAPASAASHVSPTLPANLALHPGDSLGSVGLQYRLVMQTDGNLVETGDGRALWSTGTAAHPGAYFKMQTDGNAVVYTSTGKPLWSTGTSVGGNVVAEVGIGSDGNVWVKRNGAGVVWQNRAPGTNTLSGRAGALAAEWYLHSASAKLIMQTDGNLVSYVKGKAVWSSGTAGHPGSPAALRWNGDFEVYTTDSSGVDHALWSTHTTGTGSGNRLTLGMDGRLTLFRGTTILWQS
jgi:pseudomonalisin